MFFSRLKLLYFGALLFLLCACSRNDSAIEISGVETFNNASQQQIGEEVTITGYLSTVPVFLIYSDKNALLQYDIEKSVRVLSNISHETIAKLDCFEKQVRLTGVIYEDRFTKEIVINGVDRLVIENLDKTICFKA